MEDDRILVQILPQTPAYRSKAPVGAAEAAMLLLLWERRKPRRFYPATTAIFNTDTTTAPLPTQPHCKPHTRPFANGIDDCATINKRLRASRDQSPIARHRSTHSAQTISIRSINRNPEIHRRSAQQSLRFSYERREPRRSLELSLG